MRRPGLPGTLPAAFRSFGSASLEHTFDQDFDHVLRGSEVWTVSNSKMSLCLLPFTNKDVVTAGPPKHL